MSYSNGCVPSECKMRHDHKEYNKRAELDSVRGINPTRCEGSNKIGFIPEEYKNVIPVYKVRCHECYKDYKPHQKDSLVIAPHPPGRMKFTFPIKYPDTCDVGRHKISKGERVRYLGNKLVCMKHMY